MSALAGEEAHVTGTHAEDLALLPSRVQCGEGNLTWLVENTREELGSGLGLLGSQDPWKRGELWARERLDEAAPPLLSTRLLFRVLIFLRGLIARREAAACYFLC